MELKFFKLLILCFLFLPVKSFAQGTPDFYISNKGNDRYPGTIELLPKKTIAATEPLILKHFNSKGSVKIGLKSGDVFEESLVTSYPIQISTYSDNNQNDFAILNGSRIFDTGWIKNVNTKNIYQQDIPYGGFNSYGINGIGSYSYIYVIEVDKALEKAAPFTARKILKFVTSLIELENSPGSFYSPVNTNENPKHVFIHTSDGSSPNENTKYRYEVTARDFAVNSTYQQNNRFENLWVRGYGAGIGMLPGGSNSYYNKIIFGPGAAIHHLVVRSGTIDHSLFLPGAENTGDFAVVFYDVEGQGRHCTIKNSMFLDIGAPVYAHTSLGTNFGAVEIDSVTAFGDEKNPREFMFTSNNDTVLLNNIYTDSYTTGYNYGSAKYASINNSYFKNVNFGIAYSPKNPVTAVVNNVFIKTKNSSYTAGIYMQNNTSLTLTNSIIHLGSSYASYWADAGSFLYGGGRGTSKTVATGNIFICDIISPATLIAVSTNTNNGTGTTGDRLDNNVYVLLKGNKIAWKISNASSNGGSHQVNNFDEWKRQSAQDEHSLFFDLRNDPRGLKAIFADPDNGNYDIANTVEGRQIMALGAGMTSPITCFLQKPTYEEAADLISKSKILSVNACRNPCQQNKIRVNSTFKAESISQRKINLRWNISEQQNISHYELQRSTGNSVFKKIKSIPASPDSLYSIVDNTAQPGVPYQYRLLVFAQAGGVCYSEVRSIETADGKAFTIYPNPSTGKIFLSMNGYVGKAKFTISNSMGQRIIEKEFISLYAARFIDLSNLPKGIYFIKMETGNGASIQKLLMQ